MSLEEQIVSWSASRPPWQRAVLKRVATGDVFSDADYDQFVDALVSSKGVGDTSFGLEQLPELNIGDPAVSLVSIANLEHVNALASDTPLTFEATGLTIIYGDNASGKSGYSRLLKRLARSRHQEEILSDVFRDSALATPKAVLVVRNADDEISLNWPELHRSELQRMLFYDQACGNSYIATESEFPYRPSALFVLDGLIAACDAIRTRIEGRLEENEGLAMTLPIVDEDTRDSDVGKYLAQLSGSSSIEALNLFLEKLDTSTETIDDLVSEEVRLRSGDTTNERRKLARESAKLESLKTHVIYLEGALGSDAISVLQAERDQLATLQEAADFLAKSFEAEPLHGVGTSPWKELWESARRFSELHAYPEYSFPVVTESAKCVLCHQTLRNEDGAPERLSRFERFVQDATQTRLRDARTQWESQVANLIKMRTTPEATDLNLEDLDADHAELIQQARKLIAEYEAARLGIVDSLQRANQIPLSNLSPTNVIASLEAAAAAATTAASRLSNPEKIKDFLKRTVTKRKELELLQRGKSERTQIAREIERLKRREALEVLKSETSTGPITNKVLVLAEENITEVVSNTFIRETERLHLDRVTIAKTRADKGSVLHQPKLVGARQDVTLPRVLSEGERTALGLAAFFTEAHLNGSKSALILDDPVTSLDSSRRQLVAARLAALAETRQVIVFTHDVSLVADLKREADGLGVAVGERSVTKARGGEKKPGKCSTKHPWNAKDVTERLGELRTELARMKKQSSDWDETTYEREVALWAGSLSETWERIFSQELVGPVLAAGGLEVRPKMVRVLTKFSEIDEREFEASYSRVSQWAKRHDKSSAVNYVAPDITRLEQELQLVDQWFRRTKSYKK